MPIESHKFAIKVGQTTRQCSVEMDGRPLKGVVHVSFDLSVDKITTLTLKIEGEVLVEGGFEGASLVDIKREIPHRLQPAEDIKIHPAEPNSVTIINTTGDQYEARSFATGDGSKTIIEVMKEAVARGALDRSLARRGIDPDKGGTKR